MKTSSIMSAYAITRLKQYEDRATRVVLRHPGEDVRPGERARVRVRHVDLHLRDHDEHEGEDDREPVGDEGLVHPDELLDRFGRVVPEGGVDLRTRR